VAYFKRTVERQVLYWFTNKNKNTQPDFAPGLLPVYTGEYSPGKMFYGFPDLGDGIKIAHHHSGSIIAPDENFIIDFHPRYKNICIASPCSGHGFKFSSLTGKILCDMVMGTPIPFDLSAFGISRF